MAYLTFRLEKKGLGYQTNETAYTTKTSNYYNRILWQRLLYHFPFYSSTVLRF